MSKKENIPVPSPKNIANALRGIEYATNKEEFVREQMGLTQEPEGKRVPRKQPYDIESVRGARSNAKQEEEQEAPEINGANVLDYADKWRRNNSQPSKLREIKYFKKVEFTGDMTLQLGLIDEILERAKKKDKEEYEGAFNMGGILKDIDKIKVMANKEDQDFIIQIWDKSSNLIEILVGSDGKIKTFSKQ